MLLITESAMGQNVNAQQNQESDYVTAVSKYVNKFTINTKYINVLNDFTRFDKELAISFLKE